MQAFTKVLALSLSLMLTGQSVLFASQSQEEKQSLAQLQRQANQEIKETSWLTDKGIYILGGIGTAGVLLVAQHVLHNRKMAQLTKQYQEHLNQFSHMYIENAQLRMQNTSLRWTALENKWTLESGKTFAEAAYIQRIKDLETSISALENSVGRNAFYHELFFGVGEQMEREMQPYHRLYEASSSAAEREALMKKLQKEKWFLEWPAEQQKEFLNVLKQSATSARKGEGGLIQAAPNIFKTINNKIPYQKRLIALTRGLFRSRTLGIIGVGVALSFMTPDTKAQNMANRIQRNPALFLQASPETLKTLEKSKETKEACKNVAKAVHVLSLLSAEEAAPYITQIQRHKKQASRTSNRSRHLAH